MIQIDSRAHHIHRLWHLPITSHRVREDFRVLRANESESEGENDGSVGAKDLDLSLLYREGEKSALMKSGLHLVRSIPYQRSRLDNIPIAWLSAVCAKASERLMQSIIIGGILTTSKAGPPVLHSVAPSSLAPVIRSVQGRRLVVVSSQQDRRWVEPSDNRPAVSLYTTTWHAGFTLSLRVRWDFYWRRRYQAISCGFMLSDIRLGSRAGWCSCFSLPWDSR